MNRENVQTEFAHLYQQLFDGMSHLSLVFPNIIKQRRINQRIEYDDSLPIDHEITGLLLATLFAGQYTSNITSI